MSSGRMHLRNEIHLITNRCFQERFFMLPTDKTNSIICYWFARALCKHGKGLDIFAFVFLSNHFHIIVRDTAGTLSDFMGYFQGNVAKAINKQIGRKGTFWQKHYNDLIIDGEDVFWEKYTYVVCNAVKAGLVNSSAEWIGWNSLDNAFSGKSFRFTGVNISRYKKACQNRKNKPPKKQFEETYEFSLTPPLGFEQNTIEETAGYLQSEIRKQEDVFIELRENKSPLGIKAVLMQKPTDRPLNPSFSPKKIFVCRDEQKLQERLEEYRNFIAKCREINAHLKKAQQKRRRFHCEWPIGSYPPGARYPIALDQVG